MILPEGFRAGGVAAGIKHSGAKDLALVVADGPASAAGVFTTSAAPAAPVQRSRVHIADGRARAVVLNSGCANAATGPAGDAAAHAMTVAAAQALDMEPAEVLVCSTGIIGTELPVASIEAAMGPLAASLSPDASAAAEAILTTDTKPKVAMATQVPIAGIAKGAGMIRPDMATMLSVLTIGGAVPAPVLQEALTKAVAVSFNALTVDGCMSTNDTVIALAHGSEPVTTTDLTESLTSVCVDLARQIAADGEGATRQVTIDVAGAASAADARRLGLAVADSALVRSSFAAADPNWGRVVAALGAAGIGPETVSISYAGVAVFEHGNAIDPGNDVAAMLQGDFEVGIVVGDGAGRAQTFTCDLTPAYVVENMETS